MNLTIQFDGQATLRAVEIHDVSSDAVLTPKLLAGQLGFLQVCPEQGFGGGQVFPQVPSHLFQCFDVVNWR
jgi:hypothetical protein